MAVSYTRLNWVNRVIARPNVYTMSENGDGTVTMTPTPGTVTSAGTRVNAANMNRIEKGVNDCADAINALEASDTANTNGLLALRNRVSVAEEAISDADALNTQQNTRLSALESAYAARMAIFTVNVTDSDWTQDGSLYKKTVAVAGLLGSDTPIADVVQTGAQSSDSAARDAFALVTRITIASGAATLWAAEIPEADFTIRLLCLR